MERRAFLGAAAVATGAVLPGTDGGEKNVHDVHNESVPENAEEDPTASGGDGVHVHLSPPEIIDSRDGSISAKWSEYDWERASVLVEMCVDGYNVFAGLDTTEAREFLEELREEVEAAEEYEAAVADD